MMEKPPTNARQIQKKLSPLHVEGGEERFPFGLGHAIGRACFLIAIQPVVPVGLELIDEPLKRGVVGRRFVHARQTNRHPPDGKIFILGEKSCLQKKAARSCSRSETARSRSFTPPSRGCARRSIRSTASPWRSRPRKRAGGAI